MRSFCLVWIGLLSCVAAVVAQQPAAQLQPAQTASAVDRTKLLDQHLAGWEARMKDVSSLEMNGIERKDQDKTFKYVDNWVGVAKYTKPNLASLMLVRKDKPEI